MSRIEPFDPTEYAAIYRDVPATNHAVVHAAVVALVTHGLRRGLLLTLNPSDPPRDIYAEALTMVPRPPV